MDKFRQKLRIKDFNALVFTMCLFLSLVFWLLTQLSDSQKTYTPFQVQYINVPDDFIVTNDLPKQIDLEIESQGFQLLRYEFGSSDNRIVVDMSKVKFRGNDLDKNGFLLSDLLKANFENQLKNQVEIKSISPDSLFFDISRSQKKKLPLNPILNVDFGSSYDLVDLKVIPDSMNVQGDYHFFAENKSIKFKVDSLPFFTDSLSHQVKVDLGTGITMENDQVLVRLKKENVIKQSITVPVRVINLPKGKGLQLFPNKVDVSFYSSNTVKERLSSSSFNFVVDYNEIKDNKDINRLSVVPYLIPQNVRNIKVSPGKLEFIKRQ